MLHLGLGHALKLYCFCLILAQATPSLTLQLLADNMHACVTGWAVYDAAAVANLEPVQPINFGSPLIGQQIPGYDYGCQESKDPHNPDSFCRDYGPLQVLRCFSHYYHVEIRVELHENVSAATPAISLTELIV